MVNASAPRIKADALRQMAANSHRSGLSGSCAVSFVQGDVSSSPMNPPPQQKKKKSRSLMGPILALLILFAVPAGAQDRSLLEQSSRAAVFVGNAMDLAGSVDAFSRGGVEQNRWLVRFADKPVTFAVVKTTQAVLTVWLTDKIPNRPTRIIANFAIGGFFGYLGVRNSQVGR